MNKGVAMARNAAWELAGQPYIAFLDADDAWHPKKLEIQYAFMGAHPEVVLCGHDYRMLEKGDGLDWGVSAFAIESVSKWAMLLSNRFITPSVMVRSNIPQRFVEQQRHMEDHMLWLKIVCSGAKVVKLGVPLAAIYKAPFGANGLSSEIWRMGRSDLGNYRRLFKDKLLSLAEVSFLVVFSLLKFLRRLFVYWIYLRWKN